MLTCYAYIVIPIIKIYDICYFINKKMKRNTAKRHIIYRNITICVVSAHSSILNKRYIYIFNLFEPNP